MVFKGNVLSFGLVTIPTLLDYSILRLSIEHSNIFKDFFEASFFMSFENVVWIHSVGINTPQNLK